MAITSSAVPSMTAQADNDSAGSKRLTVSADDDFLTVSEVAERLRVHPQSARGWIARGDLRATRIGRTVRVRQTDLQEMLERARIPPPTHSASPHPGQRARAAR
jgi:excisionase family DNA binding protein